jgi:Flp pilus assembly protein TadD
MKNIVFLGNCQARRLQVLYEEQFSPITGDTVDLVVSYEVLTPRVRKVLAGADVIVAQLTDAEQSISVRNVETDAQIIEYPLVTGLFLWPFFSGQARIGNEPLPHLPDGPFGQQFGDRWLDKNIKAGRDLEDIIGEYEALDVSKVVNLDRLYNLVMERAEERDRRTGFDIMPLIETSFRERPTCLTPANPDLEVFRLLAKGVYERLGIPSRSVEAGLNSLWRTVFPWADHPIHPSVARHFGLKFVGPDTRYRMLTGERLTYREWLTNYVHYRWNDALLEGTHKASRIKRFDAGAQAVIDLLKTGLAQSSGSVHGENSLAYLLQLKGDMEGATAAIRRAAAFDPDNPQLQCSLAFFIADHLGDLDEAERILRRVVERWPYYADGWNRLGSILVRRGQRADAIVALQTAVAVAPRDVALRKHLASILLAAGKGQAARAMLADAVVAMPTDPELFGELARVYTKLEDFDNALFAARSAVKLEPRSVARHRQVADIFVLRDDLFGAAAALREAVALAPTDAALSKQLSELLKRLGRPDDAEGESYRALLASPVNSHLRVSLVHGLIQRGNFREAEDLLTEGISQDPFDSTLHEALARALSGQKRFEEAQASVRRALQLKPGVMHLHRLLADTLIAAGDMEQAVRCYREAIALAADNAELHASLALLLQRLGRGEEALAAAARAVELDPRNPHFLARQAFVLKENGDLAGARSAAEAAVALAPDMAGVYGTLAEVQERSGDRQAALSTYRRAIALDSRNGHFQRQADRLSQLNLSSEQSQAAE